MQSRGTNPSRARNKRTVEVCMLKRREKDKASFRCRNRPRNDLCNERRAYSSMKIRTVSYLRKLNFYPIHLHTSCRNYESRSMFRRMSVDWNALILLRMSFIGNIRMLNIKRLVFSLPQLCTNCKSIVRKCSAHTDFFQVKVRQSHAHCLDEISHCDDQLTLLQALQTL